MNQHKLKDQILSLHNSLVSFFEASHLNSQEILIPLSAKSFCSKSQKLRLLHKKDTAPIGARLQILDRRENFFGSALLNVFGLMLLFVWLAPAQIQAQNNTEAPDSLLTPEQIDVIKPYEPVLAKAKRINVQANAPKKPEQQQRGAQTYYNPPKFIDTTFEPPSLKALGAQKQIADPVKHAWLKVGYGYKANPLVDFSASTGLSDQINAGIQLKYDAAKGNLENQQHAHIMGRAFGRFVGNKVNIESTLKYENKTHHYYGYNHLENLTFDSNLVKQNSKKYSATAKIQNNRELSGGLDFMLGGRFSFMNDLELNNNTVIHLNGLGKKYLNKNFLKVGADLTFSNYNIDDNGGNDFLLNVNPAFFLKAAGLELGANLGLLNDNAYVYPKIKIEKYIVKDKIALYAGWEKWPVLNTYTDFLGWNPFLAKSVDIQNSVKEDRYGGLRGSLTERVTFNLKVKQQLTENNPVFVSDQFFLQKNNLPFDTTFNRSSILYDSLTTSLCIHPQIELALAKQISVKASVDIVAYNFTDVKAFHIPNYFIHGGIVLKPVKNLKIEGQINWSDARLLRFELPITDGAYTPVRDAIVLDINALANYKINDNFDLFAEAKNILNQKYDIWNQYPSYGLQLRGGAIVKF